MKHRLHIYIYIYIYIYKYVNKNNKLRNKKVKKKLSHLTVYTSHFTVSVISAPGLRKTTLDTQPSAESTQIV